ncbi:hypothetical protein [Campylobacter troglodytis]|nr:hypothetical protein [Campylobacter troglodytis]
MLTLISQKLDKISVNDILTTKPQQTGLSPIGFGKQGAEKCH